MKITIFLLVLAVSLVPGAMFSEPFASYLGELFGTETKNETIKFIGWIIGGLFAFLCWLTKDKITEKRLLQERFNAAKEHLTHIEEPKRVASFHEFFRLARDYKKYYGQDVLDVLCSHLSKATDYGVIGEDFYGDEAQPHEEEVKDLVNLLFGKETTHIFDGLRFNLDRANLSGLNLYISNPQKVNLNRAQLYGTTFHNGDLSGCEFQGAYMEKTKFIGTNLQGAKFDKAHLYETKYRDSTNLSGASFKKAMVYMVYFFDSNLDSANFSEAKLPYTSFKKENSPENATFLLARYKDPSEFPFNPLEKGMILDPNCDDNP